MTTLLATLALVMGTAQAQEGLPPADAAYDLQCIDTQVNLSVSVWPTRDPFFETILYRDGRVVETHCVGGWPEGANESRLRERFADQCELDGLDPKVCDELAKAMVDGVMRISVHSPMDALLVRVRGDHPAGERVRVAIVHEDDTLSWRRGLHRDNGRLVTRRLPFEFQPPPTSLLTCEQTLGFTFLHGRIEPGGQFQLMDRVRWRCTNERGDLDIVVNLRLKSRSSFRGELQDD